MRRHTRTRALIIGGAILLVVVATALVYTNAGRRAKPQNPRTVVLPVNVQRAFQHFGDSIGPRLLDTLYALGFHGGYAWEEKSSSRRPDLIVRSELQSSADSTDGLYEGTLTLDFHHDSLSDVPLTVILRFASVRDASNWVLLTTEGSPLDATSDLTADAPRKLPAGLSDALMAPFADRIEAYDWWKNQENRLRATGRRMAP
ncbi:MAG: hypothetical protein JWM95_5643 [Gemmatimonadetes bacterium]|nr:hypothetical protein [Gemmatimonadota bacterium]